MSRGNYAAFPIQASDAPGSFEPEYGLTKREYIAALLMQAMVVRVDLKFDIRLFASTAVGMTDELLAELAK